MAGQPPAGRSRGTQQSGPRSARDVAGRAPQARQNQRSASQPSSVRTRLNQRVSQAAQRVAQTRAGQRVTAAAQRAKASTQRLNRNLGSIEQANKHSEALRATPSKVGALASSSRTAFGDIAHAIQTRNAGDIRKALASTGSVISSAKELAEHAPKVKEAVQSGARAFQRVAPRTSQRIGNAANRVKQTAQRVAQSRVGQGVANTARRVGQNSVVRTASQKARTAARTATRAAVHGAALHTAGTHAYGVATNGLQAGHDIAHAFQTRNPGDIAKALSSSAATVKSVKDLAEAAPKARQALQAGSRAFQRAAPRTTQRITSAANRVKQTAQRVAQSRVGQRVASAGRRVAQNSVVRSATQKARSGATVARKAAPHVGSLVTFGSSAANLVSNGKQAASDIRTAIRTHKAGDIGKAAQSTANTISAAKDVAEAAPKARQAAKAAARAAGRTVRRALPTTSARVASAATRAASRVTSTASRVAQSRVARSVGRAAVRTAERTGLKTAARVGAKALGRFAPGANIAIAAADTASFVKTLRDPKASTTKKVLSGVTALGSIAAATNIPVVSQVGAAVSTVSSIASSVHLPKIHLPKIHLSGW